MGRLSILTSAAFLAAVISLAAQGGAKVTFSESAKSAILSGSIVNVPEGAELKTNRPLVLTPTGIDTAAVAGDAQPEIEFQIGNTKNGAPVFASIGIEKIDSLTPDAVKEMSGNFLEVWKGGKPKQLPILMCAADGPCTKTCKDKQGKPYCCKYECK